MMKHFLEWESIPPKALLHCSQIQLFTELVFPDFEPPSLFEEGFHTVQGVPKLDVFLLGLGQITA